jgi:hypothetical protein
MFLFHKYEIPYRERNGYKNPVPGLHAGKNNLREDGNGRGRDGLSQVVINLRAKWLASLFI